MKIAAIVLMCIFSVPVYAANFRDLADSVYRKAPNDVQGAAMAVLPFRNVDADKRIVVISNEEVTNALVDLGANVCERAQFDKVLAEKVDQSAGLFTDESAAVLGAGAGAKSVLIGTVTSVEPDVVRLNIKLVDVKSYRILSTASGNVKVVSGASSISGADLPGKSSGESDCGSSFSPSSVCFNAGAGTYSGFEVERRSKTDALFAGVGFDRILGRYFSSAFFLNYIFASDEGFVFSGRIHTAQAGWTPSVRFPFQNLYSPISELSDIHLGYSVGISADYAHIHASSENAIRYDIGVCSSLVAGIRIGLGNSVSLNADYRYYPNAANHMWKMSSRGEANIKLDNGVTGYLFTCGVSIGF